MVKQMDSVAYSVECPVIRDVDVVVAGGGPGGLGAAVTAARAGAKVVLLERSGVVGGMAVLGEVSPFMANHWRGEYMDRPVFSEWRARSNGWFADHQDSDEPAWRCHAGCINKEYAALAAEEMLETAGVEILYGHAVIDVRKEGRRIDALICASRSGAVAVRGRVYVDSTGDGDLAARFGCRSEMGNAEGFCQPMTLCFKLSPVEIPGDNVWSPEWLDRVQTAYREAQQQGVLSCPRENLLMFPGYAPGVVHFNSTRVLMHDATEGVSFSEATRIARRQLRELLGWLRSSVPGFERAELLSQGVQLGVRESRRIRGLAYLTRADFKNRSHFPDAIARCNYPIDIHNPTGSGTEMVGMPDSEFYEIPYGCIVPADCDNLLIGGRSISVDHALHSSIRVMPPVCSIGQAAGMAAALSVAGEGAPPELDGRRVRAALCAMGAWLNPVPETNV